MAKTSVTPKETEPQCENADRSLAGQKEKDTSSPPLGSRRVTFLDSPQSPFPVSPPRGKRLSLSPEARVQERLTPESKREVAVQDQIQPTPWPSRRRSRTLDPSQRLQGLGPMKDKTD